MWRQAFLASLENGASRSRFFRFRHFLTQIVVDGVIVIFLDDLMLMHSLPTVGSQLVVHVSKGNRGDVAEFSTRMVHRFYF